MTKILIIRFRRIGDAVVTSSLCTTLKHSIPNAEIHYVLNDNIAPLFYHHPDIDKLITFSEEEKHSFLQYLWKILRLMHREKYDIIIDARSTINTMFFALFSLRTKMRIGIKKTYTTLVFNKSIPETMRNDVDMVQQLLELLDPLSELYNIRKDKKFKLCCTEEELTGARNYLQLSGLDLSKPIILCAVATRLDHKMWPLEKMKIVLEYILEKYDVQLIFNYAGQKEKALAHKLYDEMNKPSNVFINVEAKSLRELAALTANTNFFFGNEGGPRHIAQAFNVPSFAIYSPTISRKVWLPNCSERFQGIEPRDIDPIVANDPERSFDDKINLITPKEICVRLSKMIDHLVIK
nr:glycosyltransferase family 9 protein [uncultured Bacteroides sp.]